MNTRELKDYINRVYQLETLLYNQNRCYGMLNQRKAELQGYPDIPLKAHHRWINDTDDLLGSFALGEFIGIIIGEIRNSL